jgi:hypothetical protein
MAVGPDQAPADGDRSGRVGRYRRHDLGGTGRSVRERRELGPGARLVDPEHLDGVERDVLREPQQQRRRHGVEHGAVGRVTRVEAVVRGGRGRERHEEGQRAENGEQAGLHQRVQARADPCNRGHVS